MSAAAVGWLQLPLCMPVTGLGMCLLPWGCATADTGSLAAAAPDRLEGYRSCCKLLLTHGP